MKKVTRKSLIKKLDDLTKKIIFLRESNNCVVCGKITNLQLGHIFSRRSYSTRWDIGEDGNCHIQCAGCNINHNLNAWPYYQWYIKKHGQTNFDLLVLRWRELTHYKDHELKDRIESYKDKLKVGD